MQKRMGLRRADMQEWVRPHSGNKAAEVSEKLGIGKFLVHADFHSSNILLSAAGDGIRAILDWQLSHLGSPVEDLIRVLSFDVDAELRRAEWRNLFQRYHHRLQSRLPDSDLFESGAPSCVLVSGGFSEISVTCRLDSLEKAYQTQWPGQAGGMLTAVMSMEAGIGAGLSSEEKAAQLKALTDRGLAAIQDSNPSLLPQI